MFANLRKFCGLAALTVAGLLVLLVVVGTWMRGAAPDYVYLVALGATYFAGQTLYNLREGSEPPEQMVMLFWSAVATGTLIWIPLSILLGNSPLLAVFWSTMMFRCAERTLAYFEAKELQNAH